MSDAPSSFRARLAGDAARGARVAVAGVALFALIEPLVSIFLAHGPVRFATVLRFFALDLTLSLFLLGFVAAGLAGTAIVARLTLAAFDRPRAEAWPGLFTRASGDPTAVGTTPWVWGAGLALALHATASFGLTFFFVKRFKDTASIAASLAAIQVVLLVVAILLATLFGFLFRKAARALAPRLGRGNVFGRPLPALGLCLLLALPVALLVVKKLPTLKSVAPWRELLALGVIALGVGLGVRFSERKIFKNGKVVALSAGVALLLSAVTLTRLGADAETKYLAISASPPLSRLVGMVRSLNDFDRDGYGSLLGENDCAPFNKKVHPTARDIPDNGLDENCNGKDFSTKNAPAWKSGEKLPVPPEFRRSDYNVLLLTVDTVRYDHTTMGGYKEKRKRDTTPRMAELARRAVNFEFAQAPSAGTVASVPAIITSKFFHSGIHLGPERRPLPPKILDGNVLMAEMFKKAGYKTGAVLTHEYFSDWGLNQGIDNYDNELGAKPDPYGIKADKTTDKAQAWIARQGNARWFLWAHYIDPHGRYVKHPGEVQYGDSEEDIYDGELAWTDKQIGRLLDFIARTPAADKTIIVITSDHGDGFNEHGYINHGQKLYFELQHVPLIIYVPDIEPHNVPGPVSNLDIFPTLADLIGQDVSSLGLEGESLVPQLFYGRDARSRVVFAETNFPDPLRAAIADDYKLIYNLKANVYELYDLKKDPGEKKNVWQKDAAGSAKMKPILDEWLDRVFYSRDPGQQAQQVRRQALLDKPPSPATGADVTGAGAIKVLGYDVKKVGKLGEPVEVTLYFECVGETERDYRMEASLVPRLPPGAAGNPVRQDKVVLDGLLPTSRWKAGEYLKLDYKITVPKGWKVDGVELGFRLLDDKRAPVELTGPGGAPLGTQATLGPLPVVLTAPTP